MLTCRWLPANVRPSSTGSLHSVGHHLHMPTVVTPTCRQLSYHQSWWDAFSTYMLVSTGPDSPQAHRELWLSPRATRSKSPTELCDREALNPRDPQALGKENANSCCPVVSLPSLTECPEQRSVSSMAFIFLISLTTSCNSILLFTNIRAGFTVMSPSRAKYEPSRRSLCLLYSVVIYRLKGT